MFTNDLKKDGKRPGKHSTVTLMDRLPRLGIKEDSLSKVTIDLGSRCH
jgi:hypothetical protein